MAMLKKALSRCGVEEKNLPSKVVNRSKASSASGLSPPSLTRPWYNDGLKFKCTGCGACCKWPGDVWLAEKDIVNISKFLKMSHSEFIEELVVFDAEQDGFKVRPGDTDACRFLGKDNRCGIYPVRPAQCSTFPYWEGSMRNKRDWEETAKTCEGVNHPDAPLVAKEKIQLEYSKSLKAAQDVDQLKILTFKRSNPIMSQLNDLIPRQQGVASAEKKDEE